MIEQRLILLRKIIRKNNSHVVNQFINDHNTSICILCGKAENLTKEHVIPKWVFGNDQKKNFITNINGISQTYSKTILPACANCNSYILGALEHHIEILFGRIDLTVNDFSMTEKEKVILWLEFIDYKFQILNLRRKLKRPNRGIYAPALADIPIGIMQKMDISPSKVFSNCRQAYKKLAVKSKYSKVNSLVVYETSNKGFHFFHKVNEFIFIELPKQKVAFFYFIDKKFINHKDARNTALGKIKLIY